MYIGISIVYLLHSAAVFLLCRSRFSRKKTLLICGGMAAAQIIILFSLPSPDRSAAWAYPLFGLAFVVMMANCLIVSSEPPAQSLFVAMTYSQVFLVLIFLSNLISKFCFGSDLDATMWIRTFLHIAFLILYVALFKKKVDDIKARITEGWLPMCLLSVLYTGFIGYLSMRAQVNRLGQTEMVLFVLLLAVMITGYGVIFHTIHYMEEAFLNREIEQHEKILEQKLEIMRESEREAKRLRHDLRHHMINIAEYARKGENAALLSYLEEYGADIEGTESNHLCANQTVDNILTVYARRADQNEIEADFDVKTDKEIGIRDVDLVAILANLMENAINGCLNSGKSRMYLHVKIRTKEQKLSFLVENTCADQTDTGDGSGQKSPRRGIGLSSVMKSVEKYGGDADFRNEKGRFICRIILNLPKRSSVEELP